MRRYVEEGSPAARDALIEEYMPLARHLAARYSGSEPHEDLVQIASIGLIKAVDRFDRERGTAFSSFAVPTILGELRRHFRDRGWSIRPPRDIQETALRIDKARAQLPGKLGRTPTVNDIADALLIPQEDVLEALNASQNHYATSLDAPGPRDEDGSSSWSDRVGATDDGFELVDSVVAIRPELRQIPHRDREILRLRFMEDLTQREIADRVGLSQMQVSRILRATLEQLREAVTDDDVVQHEPAERELALAS